VDDRALRGLYACEAKREGKGYACEVEVQK